MKFQKIINRITAIVVIIVTVFFYSSCAESNADVSGKYATISDVELWTAHSTEKVFQDVTVGYDDIKMPKQINLTAIRGEREAAQIIITTTLKPVKEFTVVKSDLSDDAGNVFSEKDFTVFFEKYIFVNGGNEYYKESAYYPDCLVPFEKIVAAKENKIAANSNQGLYVRFDVSEKQLASVYRGNIQIVIDGQAEAVPVCLTVKDAVIGKETHCKSIFLNEWFFYRGELDSTEEMYDAYNRALFDYRLGCNNVALSYKDVDYYAEKVCEYAAIESCSGYNIPTFFLNCRTNAYVLNGRKLTLPNAYNPDLLKEYLMAIAVKGLKKGINPFVKAIIYGYDEPSQNFEISYPEIDVGNALDEWAYIVKQCKNDVIDELRDDAALSGLPLFDEIVNSLLEVPHVITESKNPNTEINFEQAEIVYAPLFSFVSTDAALAKFRVNNDNQLWWYGCNAPTYPYPTYHLDDTLISSRVLSWMQADYDVQGNIYWSTNYYSGKSADGTNKYLENYYESSDRSSELGEGFLFYPGAKYGEYGPLPSIRINQICDGLEEYEMIYELGKIYRDAGNRTGREFSEKPVMDYLYENMYNGTKVSVNSSSFYGLREALVNLLELAQSAANVCIVNSSASLGAYSFDVYAKKGFEIKQHNLPVTAKTEAGDGYIYRINASLGDGAELDLSVDVNGKKLVFELDLGASAQGYDGVYAFENSVIAKRNNAAASEVSTVLINAKSINPDASADEKYVQITLGQTQKENVKSDFVLRGDVIEQIKGDCKKFAIRIYMTSDEDTDAVLSIRYANSKAFSAYSQTVLKKGENVLLISGLESFRWNELKNISEIRIEIGNPQDAERNDLYFMDMSVYK